jgi:hypothetical protein
MYIHKLKIGNVELENNIILAPMAGITDKPFRIICKKYSNPGLVVTEMASAKAIYYGDAKTDKLLNIEGEKRPDNAIESTKRIKILKNDKPQNQIINTEKLNILAEEKKEIKPKIQFENEIKEQEGLFISSKSKEPLLINKNENIFIEPSKRLILSKRFENLVGNKENDINIEGIKNLQNPKNENENENENEIDNENFKILVNNFEEKLLKINNQFELINSNILNFENLINTIKTCVDKLNNMFFKDELSLKKNV